MVSFPLGLGYLSGSRSQGRVTAAFLKPSEYLLRLSSTSWTKGEVCIVGLLTCCHFNDGRVTGDLLYEANDTIKRLVIHFISSRMQEYQ